MDVTPAPTADATVVDGTGTVTIPTTDHSSNDTWTVRLVVIGLIAIVLTIIIGNIILSLNDMKTLPESMVTIAAAAAGGLGAMLASTASKRT